MAALNTAFTESAGGTSVDVTITGSMEALMQAHLRRVRAQAIPVCEAWSDKVTAIMKERAPWNDRTEEERAARGVTTPHARDVLGVVREYLKTLFTLRLTGGVYYMRYLEQRESGKWGILANTLNEWANDLGADVV